MTKEAPRTVSPRAISSQVIPLIAVKALDNTRSAADITSKAILLESMSLGIRFTDMVIAAKAPAMARRPLPICSSDKLPRRLSASERTISAALMIRSPIPVDTNPLVSPASLVNAASSRSNIPIAPRPLAIALISREAKSPTALAKIFMATARRIRPIPVRIPIPPKSASFINTANSPRTTPSPERPLSNSSQLSSAKFLTAITIILIATANRIMVTATIGSLAKPFPVICFSIMAIMANISPRSTPKPARADANLSESTNERPITASASKATAPAIFKSVSALSFACIASRLPVTPSSISLTELRNPSPPLVNPVRLSINFFIAIPMAIRSPEFMASTIPSKEAFENRVSRTFLMASRMLNNMSTKPESSANGPLVKLPLNRISITWLAASAIVANTGLILDNALCSDSDIVVRDVNLSPIRSRKEPRFSLLISDIPVTRSTIAPTPFFTTKITLAMISPMAPNIALKMPLDFTASLSLTIKSPRLAAISKRLPPTGDTFPKKSPKASPKAFTASRPIENKANTPLNARFTLSAVSWLIDKPCIKS